MKLTSKELKRQARETLNGRYSLPMTAFVVTELIVTTVNLPFDLSLESNPSTYQILISMLATIIISLLSIVLSCGLISIHLNLTRGIETKFSDLFCFFSRRPDRFILATLMLIGIILLPMIPAIFVTTVAIIFSATGIATSFVLAAIIIWIIALIIMFVLSFSYGLIYYLLIDLPDSGLVDIFKQSRVLMKGNKGRLFYIGLSFIGMSILGILSFGIGFLWIGPYMNQTNIEFYRNVIGEI